MNILAIDTSTKVLAVAVLRDDAVTASCTVRRQMRHARTIVDAVDKVLTKTKISGKELDCIACGVGPGSYTGLRIGHAFVKGFATGFGLPVYPLSSMELIAYNIKKYHNKIAVVLDARRNMFYAAFFERSGEGLVRCGNDMIIDEETLQQRLRQERTIAVTGDALLRHRETVARAVPSTHYLYKESRWYVRAASFADVLRTHGTITGKPPGELVPNYLRISEAEEKMKSPT